MIGVYICHCGTNIAGTVDVERLTELVKTLPAVSVARNYRYFCSDPGQALIEKDIKDFGLQRVVVASCSPRMHEMTFRGTIAQAGLNPYCLEMANIREHCSWVHKDREDATRKAFALIRSAVAKASLVVPLHEREVAVQPAALVVGGGIAGMRAARNIADAGFKVYLVEKEASLGGRVASLSSVFPALEKAADIMKDDLAAVSSHVNVEVLAGARVTSVEGYFGNFTVGVTMSSLKGGDSEKSPLSRGDLGVCFSGDRHTPSPSADGDTPLKRGFEQSPAIGPDGQSEPDRKISVGVIVVATGAELFRPQLRPELAYGVYDNVITGYELERLFVASRAAGQDGSRGACAAGAPRHGALLSPKSIVLIKCVGSRDKNVGNEYCSRVCCATTAKHALLLKQAFPDSSVTVFYMDVRTFGKGHEEFYDQVRESGVIYRRGNVSEIYKKGNRLAVRAEDTLTSEALEIEADLVVLATGMVPRPETNELATLLKISRGADGFLLEAHPKLRPVDTATDGIFLAGCCQGPKDITDTITQASAAAAKALMPLSMGKVMAEAATPLIDDEVCAGCRVCESMCVYGALVFDEKRGVMTLNQVLCKGCGSCGSACPSSAISPQHFSDEQLLAQVDVVSE